jgi:hypothetical protein
VTFDLALQSIALPLLPPSVHSLMGCVITCSTGHGRGDLQVTSGFIPRHREHADGLISVSAADPGTAATPNAAAMTPEILPPPLRPHREQIRQGVQRPAADAAGPIVVSARSVRSRAAAVSSGVSAVVRAFVGRSRDR